MLQYEHNQLLTNLSWEKVGQTIVNTVGQLAHVDIAILHLSKLQSDTEHYFFYQKYSAEFPRVEQDLLKLTVKSPAELLIDDNLIVHSYKEQKSKTRSTTYWACLKANISSSISFLLFYQPNLVASLTIHRCQDLGDWKEQEVETAKMMSTQATLTISQMLLGEKLKELAQRKTIINRITATIHSSLEPSIMFATIARELGEVLKVDDCGLSLWTKKDRFVKCTSFYQYPQSQEIIQDIDDWLKIASSEKLPESEIDATEQCSILPIAENPILKTLLDTKKPFYIADLEKNQDLASCELPCHGVARAFLIIPLIVEEEIIGSITLRQSNTPRYWSQADIDLAEAVASQAALAISKVLTHQKIKELAHKKTVINRITATIRSSLEPPVMFAAITKELGKALQVDGCTLSLWTKNDHFVKCVGLYNPHEPQQIFQYSLDLQHIINSPTINASEINSNDIFSTVPIGENPLLQALLYTKKPVSIKDLTSQKKLARYELPWHSKARALLIVPLMLEAEVIGSITLRQSDTIRSWSQSDIDLAEAVASQAAIAISQVLTHQQIKDLAQKETTINRITATIRSSLEPPVMFAAITKELGEALKVDGCSLSLWTKNDRFVKCVGLYNPHEPQKIIQDSLDWQQATTSVVPIAENPILQALLFSKKPVCSSDLEDQKKLARYELPWHSKARSLLIVPLIVEEEIIGSITLRHSRNSRAWSQSEIDLAEVVASQAAIAVQQAKLYETTKKQTELLQLKEQKVRQLNTYLTESVLKRFLPEAIVNKAATGELSLDLTPEPRRVTLLFCDLVGFTNLSSQLDVVLLAEILNEYLEAMSKAVFDRGGTVDKFIGDGVMAMFGAPEDLSYPEQAQRAIATATTMHFYLEKLNERWQTKALKMNSKIPTLKMRCGIHQGKAVVGMFGGGQRKDYTAVGKVVNIAARLQSVAEPNSILISSAVANSLGNLDLGQVRSFRLKGLDHDFQAFLFSMQQHNDLSFS